MSISDQVVVCVRVVSIESDYITVRYYNVDSLCSKCLALGYCASQKPFRMLFGNVLPSFSIYRFASCDVGDVLRVFLPRRYFVLNLSLIFFFPSFVFLTTAVFAEYIRLGEVRIFLLSCFSLLSSLVLVRFCFSRFLLGSSLSYEKVELPDSK